MSLLKVIETPEQEYILFKEDLHLKQPQMMVIPQTYSQEFYIEENKMKMPIIVNLFLGGMSMIGIYMIFRLTNITRK